MADKKILSDEDDILRHMTPKSIHEKEDGELAYLGNGFISKPKDEGSPSYNWLQGFGSDPEKSLIEIRKRARLTFKKTHRLAELNVGKVLQAVNSVRVDGLISSVELSPLIGNASHLPDPSHCVMTNIPEDGDAQAEAIGDIIANKIHAVHLAIALDSEE